MHDEMSAAGHNALDAFKARRRRLPAQTSQRAWSGIAAGIAAGPAIAQGADPSAQPALDDAGMGLDALEGWDAAVQAKTATSGLKVFLLTVAIGTTGVVGTKVVLESNGAPADVGVSTAPAVAPSGPRPQAVPERSPDPVPSPTAATAADGPTKSDEAGAPAASAPTRSPAPRTRPRTSVAAASSTEDALAREVELMREVRVALGEREFPRALTLLDRHALEFPDGALAQDRWAFQAIARCASNPAGRGRQTAKEFLARYPNSAHAAQLREKCEVDPTKP